MNAADFLSGDVEHDSSGAALVNLWAVRLPLWRTNPQVAGPLVVVHYSVYQVPGGTGTVLLFYDGIPPADGSSWFGNVDPTQNVLRAVPIAAGGAFTESVQFHRYVNQCNILLNTTGAGTVTRASASMLVTVDFLPKFVTG